MKVRDIITESQEVEEIKIIRDKCSWFIEESKGLALFKNLPATYADFQKVKIRRKKSTDRTGKLFNEAFEDDLPELFQRAVFANSQASLEDSSISEDGATELEPFYIFPIDGYKYFYCVEVENSSRDYKQAFDVLLEEFGDDRSSEVISELLKFTYESDNLIHGIENGCEIIIYGIPFYYCIRVSSIDYGDLYESLVEEE